LGAGPKGGGSALPSSSTAFVLLSRQVPMMRLSIISYLGFSK
jgi:hypothetical protein